MQKNQLKRKTKLKKSVQVGRGGKRGKTSGRGTKGQKARAGHRMYPEIRDAIKKFPKLRGRGKNLNTSVAKLVSSVSLSILNTNFNDGETVNPRTLVEKGLIKRDDGRLPKIKILSVGEINKKLIIEKCKYSAVAKEKLEKAGATLI